ncbi:sulfatase [Rhodococcus sp. ACPA4]|uniref:arylsulfatase n=1 Tax=unclassified Rhodococcus (in: high G+C Gram-positive bacteria) TaxID=192944 RepID=UPI000BB11DA7|nr:MULTISPECIES: arylsulfatase [unclassified Rhodococcus (in: high G+C Gram-positive bacteria)]PBC42789.1 sulfatase [Rhodococcus sp. ACPA4]RZL21179.1 MAG: arylsulfatase [Rhodococcus sp. (in: high G+C Gram-positive bacteria)]
MSANAHSRKAPEGSPNVVVIVLDDLGFGQFGCYGSDIETPNIDKLAQGGLRYNRFHVTALCSPTRAALLTGRNHHAVGMGFLADIPTSDPGYTAKIPPEAATVPRILRDAGWNTMAVGKWHLLPSGERSSAGPYDRWPSGLGFEKYYGFLRGDANHWAPELVRDNSYVDPPSGPEDGYHLTEDLADEAIRMVVNQQESAPGKPFFLYFATGAMHAPHHVERKWADDYAGQFDLGWDRWRQNVFERQVAEGIVPADTILTERPSWVPDWEQLTSDERRLYSRMHEVYAGFLTHTDAQIGRVVDSLEELGILDNTLIFVMSDNGASAEGGVAGTSNEHRFTHRIHDNIEESLDQLEDWGGIHGYPHYAWGWAWAGNTPFQLWKRYTWLGGTRVPMIAHWPKGISSGGAVRGQFAHVIDVFPTILEACGVTAPDTVGGVAQQSVDGASLLSTFSDASAPDPRTVQYFEMLGSRSIVADGWKATTNHVSMGVMDEELLMEGSRDFDNDRWSLFNLESDFSEANDVADEFPEVVAKLEQLWFAEAERNNVTPIADNLRGRTASIVPRDYPVGSDITLYPKGGPVSDEAIPRLFAGGRITADVDVAAENPEGVLFALGDWTGGFAAYVCDGVLTVTVATPGGEILLSADRKLTSGRHQLGCVLSPVPEGGARVQIFIDGNIVGTGHSDHSLPHAWQHGGTSMTLGCDRGLPVSNSYRPPFAWNGVLHQVRIEAGTQIIPEKDVIRIALQVE